jgi:hypothetical protein
MKRRRSICSDPAFDKKALPSREEQGFLLPADVALNDPASSRAIPLPQGSVVLSRIVYHRNAREEALADDAILSDTKKPRLKRAGAFG